MKASIGTPSTLSQFSSIDGHCAAATVKREFGCAAGRGLPLTGFAFAISGVQSRCCQSIRCAGGSDRPSHQTSPSSVSATLVKITFSDSEARQFGLVFSLVPGATPKKPASGLIAYSRPSECGLIQAMSSPIVRHAPALEALGRDQHREVGLAAGRREGRRDVVLPALRRSDRRGSACARRASRCRRRALPGDPCSMRCAARSTSCPAARCRRSRSRRTRSRGVSG